MAPDTIGDLKQFISTTASQQTSELRNEIADVRLDIKKSENRLSSRIDDLSASVAEALDNTNEATDTQIKNHERRIVRLEHKIA